MSKKLFLLVLLVIIEITLTENSNADNPAELDAKYQLSVYDGGLYQNHRGVNEKYLRGISTSYVNSGWYFILPSGELYSWDTSIEQSKLIATLDSSYYQDHFSLTEAAMRQSPQLTAGELKERYDFYLDSASEYFNHRGWNEKYFHGKDLGVGNGGWYFILPHGTVYSWNGTIELSRPLAKLDTKYYDDLSQLIFARSSSNPTPTAADIDIDYRLGVYGVDGSYSVWGTYFYTNHYGANEKFVRGMDFQGNGGWYFILPTGKFYSWGGSIAASKLLATFEPVYYENPFLLTEAALRENPQPTAGALNSEYGFYPDAVSDYFNYRGWSEKYFHGKDFGGANGGWYFLLPNGTIYIWNGTIEHSIPLAQLERKYYDDPLLLTLAKDIPVLPALITASSPEDSSPGGNLPQTPTPTPTPFGTTTTTTSSSTTTMPMRCEYSYLNASWSDAWITGFAYNQTNSDPGVPACIVNRLLQAWNECVGILSGHWSASYDWDNCVAWKIFGAYQAPVRWTSPLTLYGNPSYFGAQYDWAAMSNRNAQVITVCTSISFRWGYCQGTSDILVDLSDTLYIKQNTDGTCSAVTAPPSDAVSCYAGTYFWYSSPISLLWDDSVDIDKELQMVTFPLDLSKTSTQWYVWKASAKAPLLVFDPEHTGRITSATQLFGDWTFGGQSVAKLQHRDGHGKSLTEFDSTANRWGNGYEPLSTLDLDGDKRISGHELAPLGLWFDENRNGISEPGEVKQMSEVDVTAIFYEPSRLDESTNSLYADIGFERTINKQKIIGRSVDWRSDSATNKAELINKHLAPALGCGTGGSLGSNSLCPVVPLSELQSRVKNSLSVVDELSPHSKPLTDVFLAQSTLSGLWQWRSADNLSKAEGYFGFSDREDGELNGHVYSSFNTKTRMLDFSNIFSAFRLEGKRLKTEQGKIKFSFTVKPDDTSVIENEAVFDLTKQTITGVSVAKVSMGTKAVDLKYSWTATRVPFAKKQ